jgi:hypothetical protein
LPLTEGTAVTDLLPDGDGTVIGARDADDLAQPAQEPPS